jgi:hypothetical protein
MAAPPSKPNWDRLFETAGAPDGYFTTTEGLSPELLRQAAQQALRRGLVTKAEVANVEEALQPFGGLAA